MGHKATSTVQDGTVAQVDTKLEKLLQRCGIEVMPPCHTLHVSIERIVVPDLELVHVPTNFLKSIRTYGIRQPPSVAFLSGSSYEDPDATYTVVMGSRRVCSARHLFFHDSDPRFKTVKCEVYEWNVPGLSDVLALMENALRSDAWVRDIVRLRHLVEQKIVLTLDDLVDYGFARSTIKKKLDIALLPGSLLDPICAGELSWAATMQIIRLKEPERGQLAALVESGKALTADLVKQVYRGQIDQGMVAVQQAMLAMWQQASVSTNGSSNGHSSVTNGTLHRLGGDTAEQDGALSAAEMLDALQRFEQTIQQGGYLSHLTALTKAFISELQQVLRTEASELAEATTQQEVVYR
jgi:ParB-like chromosome segregation protein Spo0J